MVFIYDRLLFFGASQNVTILLSNEQQRLHKRLTPLSKHKGKTQLYLRCQFVTPNKNILDIYCC